MGYITYLQAISKRKIYFALIPRNEFLHKHSFLVFIINELVEHYRPTESINFYDHSVLYILFTWNI